MSLHSPRGYQLQVEQETYAAWAGGHRNVLVVMPTGAGKTFVLSRIAQASQTAVCAIAHRSELVTQMSVALAREGVRHRVIGQAPVRRACVSLHMAEFQRSYYDSNARVAVASVDTLARMDPAADPWFTQVGLWIQDEAHHVLQANKWGAACAMFPNARGLGVTATPVRADGRGLGAHADGVMHAMVEGPSMRELIDQGFLTEYRVFAPPSDIDLSSVPVSGSGDYSPPKLAAARRRSCITGDVVAHYLRLGAGKLCVVFDTDVESASETSSAFRAAGVPSEVVSAKTPPEVRARVLRRFRAREVHVLVNVDLFGEGFDLPAIEVVSMARPTQSYSLFAQQFGRALRPLDGKSHAIIIDHVGNVLRHGLPDARREWSLDRRERRSRAALVGVVPVRVCTSCLAAYERIYVACPYCGTAPEVVDRSSPDRVDGDLCELDPEVLARMRGEIARVDGDPLYPAGLGWAANAAIARRHQERQHAQRDLRAAIATWGGWQCALGRDDPREAYRRFYFTYGVDIGTAQTLGATDANVLTARLQADFAKHGVYPV